jgi:hypothetical protein
VGAVEREEPRLDGRQRDAAVDAREALREPERRAFGGERGEHEEAALAELQRELDAVGEPAEDALLQHDAVDHHVEVVGPRAVEREVVAEVDELAVDARAHEALSPQALELELELALARAADGREQRQPRALAEPRDAVGDLLDGLGLDAFSAARAVGHTDAREEQPQVVGDLGHRADGGARRARERPLLDRDGRREAVDPLDVGLAELLEELPRVGRERLDVAALPLGVDGVERERRLARAARAREDDELAARERQRDVLQVVLSRAHDHEAVHGHFSYHASRRAASARTRKSLKRNGESSRRCLTLRWWWGRPEERRASEMASNTSPSMRPRSSHEASPISCYRQFQSML